MKPFTEQIQAAVQRSNRSIEWLAGKLGKSAATLYDELNPYPAPGRTAKLGLEDAIHILKLIGDSTPLAYINSHFDLSTSQNGRQPDGKDMDEELVQGFQATAHFLDLAKSGAGHDKLAPAYLNATEELGDVLKRKRAEEGACLRKVK